MPAPAADSASDRAEFTQSVRAFLAELQAAIVPGLDEGQRRKVAAVEQTPGDEMHRLLGVQVVLARELPDYWQRFEAARTTYTARALRQAASAADRSAGSSAATERHAPSAHRFSRSSSARRHRP